MGAKLIPPQKNSMAEEDFDLESLATHLHLTPDQVRKMADRGKIPGRRIAGDWRFSRAEIHHWFETKIGLSDEKADQPFPVSRKRSGMR